MSWTTVIELPFTRYQMDLALDVTDFANHAQVVGALSYNGWVNFQHPDDRLVIPVKDDSLQRFTALRVYARIKPAAVPHRLNIIEGWMSFALFVESNSILVGTVYTGTDWVGVTSGNIVVPTNQWSSVGFEYDGISIARLSINGNAVGMKYDMPTRMSQPKNNITLGHWPNGDDRYTFVGDLGHVRIDRRDYEDSWRDAVLTMYCQPSAVSPVQADALRQLGVLFNSLPTEEVEQLRQCVQERSDRMRAILHSLRAGNPEVVEAHQRLGRQLRRAWCCEHDIRAVKRILYEFLRNVAGEPHSEQRVQFEATLQELRNLSQMCVPQGPKYDRMRDLLSLLTPELATADVAIEQILSAI
jgi:hypothetical protein